VNGQFVRAPQNHVIAIAALELGHGPASRNPSGVSGNGNDKFEDYVFGQEIEPAAIAQPIQASASM
jgi:hypothetical protein